MTEGFLFRPAQPHAHHHRYEAGTAQNFWQTWIQALQIVRHMRLCLLISGAVQAKDRQPRELMLELQIQSSDQLGKIHLKVIRLELRLATPVSHRLAGSAPANKSCTK